MLQPPNTLKITDFGSAEVFRTVWETEPHKSRRLAGSEPYIAPEEFTEKEFDPVKVDTWACGIIYLTMIYNRIPWRAATSNDANYSFYLKCLRRMAAAAAAQSPTSPAPSLSPSSPTSPGAATPEITTGFPMLDHLPAGPRSLMLKLLDPDPSRRITVVDARKDPWFRSVVKERVARGDQALSKSDVETERGGGAGLGAGLGSKVRSHHGATKPAGMAAVVGAAGGKAGAGGKDGK
ncbi:serine/threonine-protein kinase HAL4/sat4 [Gonapodya sp. JEL0774]|nr:serine/threonine-protein kinase HAL4/sat4 [Gonapodya sp. JEL0774]